MNEDMREAVEACRDVLIAQRVLRAMRARRDVAIRKLEGSPDLIAAELRQALFSMDWPEADVKLVGISAGAVRLMRERPSLTDGAESETLGA